MAQTFFNCKITCDLTDTSASRYDSKTAARLSDPNPKPNPKPNLKPNLKPKPHPKPNPKPNP